MTNCVFLNGNIIAESDAKIAANDRGFLLGDGVFDTMRAYRGVPFMIENHLARLFDSASFLRIAIPLSKDEMAHAVKNVIETNKLVEAYVRITITRGAHYGDLSLDSKNPPTIIISAKEVKSLSHEDYRNGVPAVIVKGIHNPPALARHKTTSYLPYLLARDAAAKVGTHEAIIVTGNGRVLESATGNVFVVSKGVVKTPSLDEGILPGIARKVVLDIMRTAKIEHREERLTESELQNADEIFVTNSIMEVLPIRSIDGRALPKRELSHLILEAYRIRVTEYLTKKR